VRVLLEDKNQTVDIPDGLSPEQIEAELRKFYTPEELYGSTTFGQREDYRLRKGRAMVEDGNNWYEAMVGARPIEEAKTKSAEINADFTEENDEKYQAYNWPERFAGATTELAPYMLDSAIQGGLYGEALGATAAGAAAIAGQAGPQIVLPEEIITVPAAYIGGRAVGQAYGTWMNAAKIESGHLYKSLIDDGIDPATARNFAAPAGYLIGAIELLQVERLIPGFGKEGITNLLKAAAKKGGTKAAETLGKFSGRLAANLAKTTAVETGQELAQDVVGITAEIGASIYEDMSTQEGYFGPGPEDIKLQLQDTLTSSLFAFPLLGLPRAIHSTASLHSKERFAERFLTKKAQKSLNLDLTEFIEKAAESKDFQEFQQSIGEEIDDKAVNKLGFDNRTLFEEAIWNQSRNLQGEHIYEENFRMQEESGDAMQPIVDAYRSVEQSISRIAEPISTRLKQINPKLKNKMRRYEFDLKQQVLRDERAVKPFLEGYKKLSDRDKADLDLALKNSDKAKIDEVLKRNSLEKEFESVKGALNAAHKRATESGVELGFIEDYFPRQVKDVKGMLKFFQKEEAWPEMVKAIKEKEEKLGRKMTDDEKAELLNTMLKGFKGKAKPGNVKGREISVVTPQINQFYQESPQALVNYIYKVNDYIEARRFFGKSVKGSEMSGKMLEQSIGNFVLDLLASGDIKGTDAKDIEKILSARFQSGAPSKGIAAVRNITYIETMGSIISAITQVGDIYQSLYKNGFYKTGKALAKTVTGQAELSKEDIGIELIAEEFSDKSKTQKALQTTFKLVGLTWMDRLGKETLINSTLERLYGEAKNPTKKFIKQINDTFGNESEQVIKDLQSETASDNVKYLLFSQLADFQPIALSEMPENYLKSGNGRIFYMLKTYTIKQFDVFRNECFIDMKNRPAEAIGNLIRLTALIILSNGTADLIKDLILGREIDFEDYLLVNIMRLFGFSKYNYYKFKTGGIVEGVASVVVPPFGDFIGSAAKDLDRWIEGEDEIEPHQAEIIQSIPVVGKVLYWWIGGGRKKIEEAE